MGRKRTLAYRSFVDRTAAQALNVTMIGEASIISPIPKFTPVWCLALKMELPINAPQKQAVSAIATIQGIQFLAPSSAK